MSLTLHYCGDKVESIGLNEDISCCCEEETDMQSEEDDCCKNEIKQIKISLDQIKESGIDVKQLSVPLFPAFLNTSYTENNIVVYKQRALAPTPIPHPPDKNLFPSVLQFTQSYLFYS